MTKPQKTTESKPSDESQLTGSRSGWEFGSFRLNFLTTIAAVGAVAANFLPHTSGETMSVQEKVAEALQTGATEQTIEGLPSIYQGRELEFMRVREGGNFEAVATRWMKGAGLDPKEEDVRPVVGAIMEVNGFDTADLPAGEVLVVPGSELTD